MVLGCLAVGGAAATAGIIGTGDILGITTVVAGITTVVAGITSGGGHGGGGHGGGGHGGGGHGGGGHGGGGHGGGGHGGGGHGGGGHGGGGHGGGGHHSDIRLKEDIVPLARLDNGIELYRFRYKGRDHTAYVGVMAQEVQEIEPSAVWRDRDGYLVVNYDRLGLKFMTWDEWLARISANYQSAH